MKGIHSTVKWFLAIALVVTMAMPALAAPPVATPKKSPPWPNNVPPVPRAIPDLYPYWKFDPPQSKLFDMKNFVLSGDLRVRPEFRTNGTFGSSKRNDFAVQQWIRLGLNYSISPDVEFFIQPQYAKNWGAGGQTAGGAGNCTAGICANDPFHIGFGDSFFVRQGYVLIRNAGLKNLSVKLGRQLVVFGNHRLFGHFDWANTGFSHDGIMFEYAPRKTLNLRGGWSRVAESDVAVAFPLLVPGVGGPNATVSTDATDDADLFHLRAAWKPMKGLSIEPMWAWFINGGPSTGEATGLTQAHAPNQQRHTVGGRAAFKHGMFDLTAEYYWQFGSMGVTAGSSSRDLSINAWAGAVMGGVTLPLPMKPRIGLEFNGASGDGDATTCTSAATCGGNANTFENLYPTNHILMGYMDLFAWRNMIGYSADLKLKPTAASHVEVKGWVFRRQNSGDNWYRAAQNVYFAHVPGTTTSSSLGQEIDVIYTHFFKQGKVAWQLGYGHFFPGKFVEQAVGSSDPPGQDWGYTQVHVNF